jgi:opacity protein-like surface antigen
MMPRSRQHACLQNGLRLNLNRLIRRGIVEPGAYSEREVSWTDSYAGEQIASGLITADMSGWDEGCVRIQLGQLDQRINLVSQPRHFGGRQWYFICPSMNRRVSVLWMPLGAREFACRQRWGRQVAYASQFLGRDGEVKINGTNTVSGHALCGPCESEFPFSQTQTFGHSQINTGWVVGYGTEGHLPLMPGNWTWKIEGLYMDLGTLDATSVTTASSKLPFFPGFLTGGQVTTHSHFTDGILRGGLNYKFY